MTSSLAQAAAEITPVEKRIAQNIKRFDICSLLKLLQELGYREDEIYFQSNPDLSSRASLCENIFFSENMPRVTIVLNLGILSGNSPLPSYFRKKMDSGSIDPILFTRFVNFFDHHILKNMLAMSMPDMNSIFFADWNKTQGHYLKMLDLNSTSTLWHLFQLCFSELIVKVVKQPRVFKEKSSSIMLGNSRLGRESLLGKRIEQTIPSYKFILIGEEMVTDLLIPWPLEVRKRLKTMIYPLLERTSIHFRVSLVVKNNKSTAQPLSACTSRLGYCRVGESDQPHKLLIFSGYSQDLAKLR